MNNLITDKSMKPLLRNPIGLLGLLALLFDSIIGIVLTVGIDKLTSPSERLPLIWFLIGYPVLVLILFAFLAIFRPRHLYSPQDYGDGAYFLKATAAQTRTRREKEVEELMEEEKKARNTEAIQKDHSESGSDNTIESTPQAKEANKSDKELRKELKSQIVKAEEVGIEIAEKYLGLQLTKDLRYEIPGLGVIQLDGYGIKNGITYVVEIKRVTDFSWKYSVRRAIETLKNEAMFMSRQGVVVPVLVVVATNLNREEEIKDYTKSIDPSVLCIVTTISK